MAAAVAEAERENRFFLRRGLTPFFLQFKEDADISEEENPDTRAEERVISETELGNAEEFIRNKGRGEGAPQGSGRRRRSSICDGSNLKDRMQSARETERRARERGDIIGFRFRTLVQTLLIELRGYFQVDTGFYTTAVRVYDNILGGGPDLDIDRMGERIREEIRQRAGTVRGGAAATPSGRGGGAAARADGRAEDLEDEDSNDSGDDSGLASAEGAGEGVGAAAGVAGLDGGEVESDAEDSAGEERDADAATGAGEGAAAADHSDSPSASGFVPAGDGSSDVHAYAWNPVRMAPEGKDIIWGVESRLRDKFSQKGKISWRVLCHLINPSGLAKILRIDPSRIPPPVPLSPEEREDLGFLQADWGKGTPALFNVAAVSRVLASKSGSVDQLKREIGIF